WAVVTSGARAVAIGRLETVGLPVPAAFVAADDVTAGKPDPEGYLRGARLLGVDPADCVVVEDAEAGLRAAHAAGMRAIAVGRALGEGSAGARVPWEGRVDDLRGLTVEVTGSGGLCVALPTAR
ncbi:MAG: HAD-IA family hydrolase, partial [Streptomycetaceae bacterium]|nr:HAD-IA family hydrolase [Streptomycetaceae bacterium]